MVDDEPTDCGSKLTWYATLCFNVCGFVLVKLKPFQAGELPTRPLHQWHKISSEKNPPSSLPQKKYEQVEKELENCLKEILQNGYLQCC